MKKLFALVLTLALVFAIAAPAMAATWGAGSTVAGSPYVVKVTRLQKTSDSYGNDYFTAYPANVGVVAASAVYFQVDVTVPTTAQLQAFYPNPLTAGVFNASVTTKNIGTLAIVKEFVDGTAASAGAVATTDGTDITLVSTGWDTGDADDAITYSAIFSGVVTATKDATVTASVGYKATTSLPLTKTVAGKTYTIADPADATTVSDGTNTLTLTLNSSSVVTGMTLTNATRTYTVQPGPVFQYIDGTEIKALASDDVVEYAAVVAAYNAMTSLLGFKAGDANIYYTAANILANFGYNNRATDVGTWKGYTANLTVTDGTQVPNTGDNMSVIGFVMVGLALLATAAVIVKKVRA